MDDEPKKLITEFEGQNGEVEAELVKARGASVEAEREAPEEMIGEGEGQLTIDVYQTPEEIVVESPIAGVDSDNLDISITNESVTIKGKREHTQRIREEDYIYQECYWGKFSRSVILPQEIDADRAQATIKNGVLIIHLPKLVRGKPKKIKVRID